MSLLAGQFSILGLNMDFAHVMQGLISLTKAWLRRMDAMISVEAAKADPCTLRFHDWDTKFGCTPLEVIQYRSLRHLLPRVPVFASILGQYAAAHAAEVVPASPEAGSTAISKKFEASHNLHMAMQECVKRCVVRFLSCSVVHF